MATRPFPRCGSCLAMMPSFQERRIALPSLARGPKHSQYILTDLHANIWLRLPPALRGRRYQQARMTKLNVADSHFNQLRKSRARRGQKQNKESEVAFLVMLFRGLHDLTNLTILKNLILSRNLFVGGHFGKSGLQAMLDRNREIASEKTALLLINGVKRGPEIRYDPRLRRPLDSLQPPLPQFEICLREFSEFSRAQFFITKDVAGKLKRCGGTDRPTYALRHFFVAIIYVGFDRISDCEREVKVRRPRLDSIEAFEPVVGTIKRLLPVEYRLTIRFSPVIRLTDFDLDIIVRSTGPAEAREPCPLTLPAIIAEVPSLRHHPPVRKLAGCQSRPRASLLQTNLSDNSPHQATLTSSINPRYCAMSASSINPQYTYWIAQTPTSINCRRNGGISLVSGGFKTSGALQNLALSRLKHGFDSRRGHHFGDFQQICEKLRQVRPYLEVRRSI